MKEPIRVLCVFSTLDQGGAETMCMNLYRHIDRSVVQFDFVKHTSIKGAYEDEIINYGGRIFEAPRFPYCGLVKYCSWWKKHLEQHPEHQIIHGHYFTISAVYFWIAKRFNRYTVGHIHASSIRGLGKEMLIKLIPIVTDYSLACSQIAGKWAYGNRPFRVFHNAVDTATFRYNLDERIRIREELKLQDKYVIGTVANLSYVKNPIGLVEIFKEIKKMHPNSILVWIGEGELRKTIEEKIHNLNLEKSVMLLGRRTDVHGLLQAMDVFVLPSFNEGLPVSAVEAQAAGLQCYLSDRITREVDITGNCYFLPIEKPDVWAKEIAENNAARFDTTKKVIAAGYDIDNNARDLEDFYLSIVKDKMLKKRN